MLLNTHKRIAEKISMELKLSSREALQLEKGSVKPDYWKNFPHHYGKDGEIKKRVVEARRLFLNGNKLESLFWAGVALHYIQDSWVTVPSSSMNHGWWEDQISFASFVDDIVRMINNFDLSSLYKEPMSIYAQDDKKKYLQTNENLLEFYQMCGNNFEGYDGRFAESTTLSIATLDHPKLGTPIFDLNFAYRVCLMVALSVYQSKTSSTLQEDLKQIRKEFEIKLRDAEETLAKKLVDLNNKKAQLEQKHGFINALNKIISNINIWFNRRRYEKRSHLLKVEEAYYREVEQKSRTFENWYIVTIPKLDIEQVKRLLA